MIALRPATPTDRIALGHLMQLYCYDWSELVALDVGDDGRFDAGPHLDAYWHDAWRHPFMLSVEGKLAGFALIHSRSHLTGADGVFDMAEFFVMRRYRRRGVGLAAAFAAFDRFPGRWEIRQRDTNPAATAFWRRAIGQYTDEQYNESRCDSDVWTGPVQTFTSAGPRSGSPRT